MQARRGGDDVVGAGRRSSGSPRRDAASARRRPSRGSPAVALRGPASREAWTPAGSSRPPTTRRGRKSVAGQGSSSERRISVTLASAAGVDQPAMGGVDRGRRDVGGGDVVAAGREQFGQHADRTAGLERVPVARMRQQRHRDRDTCAARTTGPAVATGRPTRSTSDRSSRRGVARSPEHHLSHREQPLQHERRQDRLALRRWVALRVVTPRGVACVRSRRRQRHVRRRSHGTAASPGDAQCHIHTGYSSSTASVRAARRPPRPGRRPRGRGGRHRARWRRTTSRREPGIA